MMIKKIIFSHYFLILFFSLSLASLYFLSLNRTIQLVLFLSASVFYIIWGIGHHRNEDRKDKHIMLEYILLGLIGVILTLIIFFPFF